MKIITVILTSAGLLASTQAATIITLAGDQANSSAPAFNSTLAVTLTDGFLYDPLSPTSPSPNTNLGNNANRRGFHGLEPASADVTLNYTLNHTVTALEPVIVLDFWGRNANQARDDDFDIELLDSSGGSLGLVTGLAAPDVPTAYVRGTFPSLAAGTQIAGLRIVGHDSENAGAANDDNNFTVLEVRLAAIPEPSTGLLCGLAGLALIMRRRK